MEGPVTAAAVALLFDIDGTILRPGCLLQRAHMRAMETAVQRVSGFHAEFEHVAGGLYVQGHSLSGYTDAGTIGLLLELAGTPVGQRKELTQRIVNVMCHLFHDELGHDEALDDLLPGVARLVTDVNNIGGLVGLSTGNSREVAGCKMRATGLRGLERIGGFGDQHADRRDVVRSAVADARERYTSVWGGMLPLEVIVIGDTPSDVLAARAAGVRSLAVASGAASGELLCQAEPDTLVDSLIEVSAMDLVSLVHQS